jgi:UDP:flavonoid glycosyltransferase YjiC (YdhE family)
MRLLFTTTAARGALTPLVPVAAALREAGHEVAFCSAASFRADVERAGFGFFPAGVDYHMSDPGYPQSLCGPAGLVFPTLQGLDRLAWVTAHVFIGLIGRSMLPDVVATARKWGAALIVRESLEFSGCTAAEVLGLPHASVAAAANCALDQRTTLAPALTALRADAGLSADDADAMPYRYLHLCFSPPSFDGPGAAFPPTARFFAQPVRGDGDGALGDWLGDLDRDRPLVVVSMGTIFHRLPGVYEAVVEALAALPVAALVALGFDRDPASLGPQPPTIRIEPVLPVAELLPHCQLFVTHGGFNSVKEALAAGTPMVMVPLASDQFYSAQRCSALGLAEVVGPSDRRPDRIRAAIRSVLDGAAYTMRAHELQKATAALPPVEDTVGLLEALAGA